MMLMVVAMMMMMMMMTPNAAQCPVGVWPPRRAGSWEASLPAPAGRYCPGREMPRRKSEVVGRLLLPSELLAEDCQASASWGSRGDGP